MKKKHVVIGAVVAAVAVLAFWLVRGEGIKGKAAEAAKKAIVEKVVDKVADEVVDKATEKLEEEVLEKLLP